MLNIYRVISMSLAVSLFFAAPLLCVSPISVQLKKGQRLTTRDAQGNRVRVVQQRVAHRHIRKEARASAWARATHRFLIPGHELPLETRNQVTTPTHSPDGQEYRWHSDHPQGLDEAVVPAWPNDTEAAPYGSPNDL